MTKEPEEVFRGHLEECVQHLGLVIDTGYGRGTKGINRAREPIAEFCGVSIDSVIRWLRGSRGLPVGEQLFKLMCYLDVIGYRVIELERLSQRRRHFLELIGFGILSAEEACQIAGYAKAQTLYQVLYGKQGVGREREERMLDAWKSRRGELEQKKTEARERYLQPAPRPVKVKVTEVRQRLVRVDKTAPIARRPAIVSLMEGLLTLLEESSFEEHLRAVLADHPEAAATMLQLMTRLNTLSFKLVANQIEGGD